MKSHDKDVFIMNHFGLKSHEYRGGKYDKELNMSFYYCICGFSSIDSSGVTAHIKKNSPDFADKGVVKLLSLCKANMDDWTEFSKTIGFWSDTQTFNINADLMLKAGAFRDFVFRHLGGVE